MTLSKGICRTEPTQRLATEEGLSKGKDRRTNLISIDSVLDISEGTTSKLIFISILIVSTISS